MGNPVEDWKAKKHGLDVWPDVLRYADARTPMKEIDGPDLERMKWHGFYYRKRDKPGRYMTRIRITGSELSAAQAKEVAYIAYEYGHGIVDVTTRANLQVQGLEIEHLPKVADRLAKVGLSSKQTGHDNIRNVFAHPYSGLLEEEIYDTRRLCQQVTDLFIDSRVYSDLPRKFNICLNGTAQHGAHFWTQDLSFLATQLDGDPAFHALVGGTQGQNPRLAEHLPVLVRPNQVVDVTRVLLDLFRERGSREKRNAARFRYLLERIGVAGVLAYLEEKLPYRLQPSARAPLPAATSGELVGWVRQRDPEHWIMGLNAPLGRLTWRQLEGLAVLSRRWADGALRTTHEQGVAVVNVPNGFRDAAATDAAALGLSVHADSFDLNTVACTGAQFCNIAVTETKGRMFRLIDELRRRSLQLHGIRIHMSGCPSSCAQHFTADIGLKGVRVRRLLGTREGFDVYLGGGIAGQVYMGSPYRLGVDGDQLPTLIESVIDEYYLKHQPGQTFSTYWRDRLIAADAVKVGDDELRPPVWLCEQCGHRHGGEDPPVFCPSCAGIRRNFARLEEDAPDAGAAECESRAAQPTIQSDGFLAAGALADFEDGSGRTVELMGKEYALFRLGDEVRCLDAACPHEGAQLADGELRGEIVVCPWHDWEFSTCDGCSLSPPGHRLGVYETRIADGTVFVKVGAAAVSGAPRSSGVKSTTKSGEARLLVREIVQETPNVKTFRLDNSAGTIPFDFPGKFVRLGIELDGALVWRSFTISSSPANPKTLDVTVKLNPTGEFTRRLFDTASVGCSVQVKGSLGAFYFDPAQHGEPLALISCGSGITPMMSIARYVRDLGLDRSCAFLHGAREASDVIFRTECEQLAAESSWFHYRASLSRPTDDWNGESGRIDFQRIANGTPEFAERRFFLCGPIEFMDSLRRDLVAAGVPEQRVHTEQFHAARPMVAS